jgi:molybdopterin adenylyltransferase
MQTWIQQAVLSPYKVESIIIEDEQALIEQTMVDFADHKNCYLQFGAKEWQLEQFLS